MYLRSSYQQRNRSNCHLVFCWQLLGWLFVYMNAKQEPALELPISRLSFNRLPLCPGWPHSVTVDIHQLIRGVYSFVKISSHSIGFQSIWMSVPFVVQKPFSLMRYHLWIVFLTTCANDVLFRKSFFLCECIQGCLPLSGSVYLVLCWELELIFLCRVIRMDLFKLFYMQPSLIYFLISVLIYIFSFQWRVVQFPWVCTLSVVFVVDIHL